MWKGKQKEKIPLDYGMRDYYRFYRYNLKSVTQEEVILTKGKERVVFKTKSACVRFLRESGLNNVSLWSELARAIKNGIRIHGYYVEYKPTKLASKKTLRGTQYDINYKQFSAIWKDLMYGVKDVKGIPDMVLENPEGIEIPYLGNIRVRKSKIKYSIKEGIVRGLRADYVATRKLWEKDEEAKKEQRMVYYIDNSHTDGYRYKIFWDRSKVACKNIMLYSFKSIRKHNRKLAQLLLNKSRAEVDYYEL